MRKSIGAHHSLVGLHHKTCGLAHHAAGGHDLRGVNADIQIKKVAAGTHCHHHLFQGAIARPLAQTIDGALHLARTANFDTRQRVGYCHA